MKFEPCTVLVYGIIKHFDRLFVCLSQSIGLEPHWANSGSFVPSLILFTPKTPQHCIDTAYNCTFSDSARVINQGTFSCTKIFAWFNGVHGRVQPAGSKGPTSFTSDCDDSNMGRKEFEQQIWRLLITAVLENFQLVNRGQLFP